MLGAFRNNKNASKTLPIFMLAGILIIVSLIFRLVLLLLTPDVESYESKRVEKPVAVKSNGLRVERPKGKIELSRKDAMLTGNVFEDIHTKYPGYKTKAELLVQENVPYSGHNPIQGDAKSSVQITIFTDAACMSCRTSVRRFLNDIKPYMDKALLVYKFAPVKRDDSAGGVFEQVAWRAGVFDDYFEEVLDQNTLMGTDDYLSVLERVGIPLDKQQRIMREQMSDIVYVNQQDVLLAERLGVYKRGRLPVFYINGYRLGQAYLSEMDAPKYIERLLKGQSIVADK